MKTSREWLALICGDKSKHQNRHPETVHEDCQTCRERVRSIQADARLDGYEAGFKDALVLAEQVVGTTPPEGDHCQITMRLMAGIRSLLPTWQKPVSMTACPRCGNTLQFPTGVCTKCLLPPAEDKPSCPGCEALRREAAQKEKWLCQWLHSYRGSLSESLAAVIRTEESLRHSEKCIDPIIKEMWDRGVRP